MNKVIITIAQRSVILMFLLVLCGCPGKKEASSPYKVIDSGIWITPGPEGKVFWLDNDRAVFITYTSLKPGGDAKALTIWSPKTGKIEQPFQAASVKCVNDGVIAFGAYDESGTYHLYRGTLNSLTDITSKNRDLWFDEYFDCNWIPARAISKPPYFYKLKDDNWLEIIKKESGNRLDKGEMRYYESREKPPVKLPLYADTNGYYRIRYNTLRNAYFISPSQYYPDDSYYHSLWWLHRDGTITEEPLPIPLSFVKPLPKPQPKGSGRGMFEFFPLKEGYMIDSGLGGVTTMTSVGSSGLYLLKDNKIEPVLLGQVGGVSISPDGCQAIFSYSKTLRERESKTMPYRTVRYINFCEGSDKK